MTGTPKGVGAGKNPPLFLKNGDEMSVWVGGGVGTLYNPVVEERESAKAKLRVWVHGSTECRGVRAGMS